MNPLLAPVDGTARARTRSRETLISHRLPRAALRRKRRVALAVVIVPVVGVAAAAALTWGRGLSAVDLGVLALMYAITGVGVTAGFHRLFSHRSFDAPRPVRALLAIAGCMAIEGPLVTWVADHRRHHAFSDREGDPHSPNGGEPESYLGALRDLWHAHVGWMLAAEQTFARRFAPDVLADRVALAVDRCYLIWVALSLALPAAIGLALTRTAAGAASALVWGGFVRIFLVHHVTWSVNSICHYFGSRPFRTDDLSTNNWLLALPSFGEAWHNNHHAFPGAALNDLEWWQVDLSGLLIRALERLGLVYDVARVPASRTAVRRAAAAPRPSREDS
jgi:stearoyl-CoA desaturase (delta-9 desaturase)